ncbi:FAD-dependent monooxygenase [Gemmobacter sp.]|uniref:FAD-dependent monooxygenase n=1 Tax=Gemmobacter sp. TaxID=1898957 RepID=UPI002AFDCE5B|nr:FAD-dependent monooxygenase [Gemmobacter sp.]
MPDDFDADVLIVGAGPSGLALAAELELRGHRCILVERNERTGVQPRAKTTNVRSMTHLRRWRLADKVRARSPLGPDFPRDVVFTTGLFDVPIHTFHDALATRPGKRDVFPEHAEFVPQYVVEGVLADHVAARCDLRFRTRMTGFVQDDRGVTATLTGPDGTETRLRARYLAGADGGRSRVREALGIEMQGKRDLMTFATLILRVPGLAEAPGLRRALFHWIVNPAAASVIGPMDRDDRWYWARPAAPDTPTEVLMDDARRAIGPGFDPALLARDNWVVHSLLAESYRRGRVFLLGDACHLHSPFGGHGMNLGIGDAADLGWKLSAALQGWGTDTLLDSYQTERRQAHEAVIDSATRNFASLSDHFADPRLMQTGPEADAFRAATAQEIERRKAPEFRSLGLVLGYRYTGSPAVIEEPGAAPELHVSDYRPTARPGHLLPHAWLADGASLYDRIGPGFTLLVTAGGDAGDLPERAAARGIPLTVVAAPGLRGAMEADFVLVRPDQHVAWRGDQLPPDDRLLDVMQGGHVAEPMRKTA